MSSLDSAENFENSSSDILSYSDTAKKRGRKVKTGSEDEAALSKKPLKASFDEDKLPEGLASLLATQKQYNVRYDLGEIILEALAKLSDKDWSELSEEKIPENVKIMAALEDPDMREKLMNLINSSKLQN